jgi:hypothetical protein
MEHYLAEIYSHRYEIWFQIAKVPKLEAPYRQKHPWIFR